MQYRRLTQDEPLYAERMQSFAFRGTFDEEKIREDISNGKYADKDNWGAIDENGKLASTMEALPYDMWFDGSIVPMIGIGGVTSLPEYRRSGHIRNIFKALFQDMYEKGIVFSHLYPFSFDYYRKFGYEAVGASIVFTLPIPAARKYYTGGSSVEYAKDMPERETLINIYEKHASQYNNMVSKSIKRWDEVFSIDQAKWERIYFWKNNLGIIKSWVKFTFPKDDGIRISEYAWVDTEGMLGLLDFFSSFDGAAKTVEIKAPADFSPELFWADLYNIQIKYRSLGMNRIVNVKKGLELMKKPSTPGNVVIKVNDSFAEWNSKTYSISYSGDGSEIKETTATPDLEVNERAMLQLMLGCKGFDALTVKNDIIVNSKREMLRELFPAKKINITENF